MSDPSSKDPNDNLKLFYPLIKYDELLATFANNSQTGEASSADKSQAARESGYTTELIRNTNDAEIMANVYLDGRRNAVSMQRLGLAQSVFEQFS